MLYSFYIIVLVYGNKDNMCEWVERIFVCMDCCKIIFVIKDYGSLVVRCEYVV